jgi:NAD(P)-dependent dehydrogenase (short-subunit alcohol dehydrogenase family)
VTGASYGIGAATALAFARAGYDLALCDLDPQTLATTGEARANASATLAYSPRMFASS